MLARLWGKMIWLYRRFSQKLAESCVGIVPCQGWSAAEALKTAYSSAGFRVDHRLRLFGSTSTKKRTPGLIASEPVLDCARWSQGAGVWI